jgi:hypothetical protein
MIPLKDTVIESMNTLLWAQARLVKHGDMEDVYCHLVQFDNHVPANDKAHTHYGYDGYEVLVNMETLDWYELPDLSSYQPRGMTALYDSLNRFIDEVGARLSEMKEEDRPGTVTLFINTDGMDNDSHYCTVEALKEKIRHQEEKYAWKFIFMSSSLEAANQARTAIGITDTVSYSPQDTARTFETLSKTITRSYLA